MEIREISAADVVKVTEIYNYYIESTAISFEEEPVASDEMAQRIKDILELGFPWLVCEVDGKVVAYAYANCWKPRSAYRFTVEPSIYVDPQFTGKGIGKELYSKLFETLKQREFKNVIGVIALPNPSSIRLHEKLGFKKVGEFSNIGVKFGQKHSVGYWQLELSS